MSESMDEIVKRIKDSAQAKLTDAGLTDDDIEHRQTTAHRFKPKTPLELVVPDTQDDAESVCIGALNLASRYAHLQLQADIAHLNADADLLRQTAEDLAKVAYLLSRYEVAINRDGVVATANKINARKPRAPRLSVKAVRALAARFPRFSDFRYAIDKSDEISVHGYRFTVRGHNLEITKISDGTSTSMSLKSASNSFTRQKARNG